MPVTPSECRPSRQSPWYPNMGRISKLLQGSWFSTPAGGQCANGHRPGDGSGCRWRAVALERAVNYSCVNARIGDAVIKSNPPCFSKCGDGREGFPKDPSDCWTLCFFNTILGNSTFGYPGLKAAAITTPFNNAFKPEADGGCPEVPVPQQTAAAEDP